MSIKIPKGLKLLDDCEGLALDHVGSKTTAVSTYKQLFPKSGSTSKKVFDDLDSKAPIRFFLLLVPSCSLMDQQQETLTTSS